MPGFSSIGWVLLGGGLGSGARFLLQKWASHALGTTFPYGTLLVNIAGCLLIGFFFPFTSRNGLNNPNAQLFLMTGLCGGFTTFSAITFESMVMLQNDRWAAFLLYASASVFLGLIATLAGDWLAKTIIQ
jgi:CrcB protein